MRKEWYEYLESLDRRIIYVVVLCCLIMPYLYTCKLPLPMDTGSKSMFESIEKLYKENQMAREEGAKGKIALIVTDWDAGTKAELWPQTVAIMVHLYQRDIPFAILSMIPEGPTFARFCIEDVRKLGQRKGIDGRMVDYSEIAYGTDYCEWGYKFPETPVYLGLASNLYSIVEADMEGTPIREVPMMKDVEGMHDVGFVFHAAGSGMIHNWLRYVRPNVLFDLGAGVTAIMGPEFSPYLQSGQVCGVLSGMSGAYMYEQETGFEGLATAGMAAQNVAHIWVIIAMLLGNIGYIMLRRKKAREEEKAL